MTIRRALGGLSTALLTVTLLSGCSESEGGTASPIGQPTSDSARSSASAPSSSASTDEAPRVAEPIDVSGLEQEPCAALSPEQVQKLSLLPGVSKPMDSGAPTCIYEYNDNSGSRVRVVLVPEFPNGLSDLYARRPNLAYFEPTEVSGYPAVYASPYDSRSQGICDLHVGLTDEFIVSMMVQLGQSTPDYPRGCEVAELSAQTMIENLKGGA